MGFFFSLQQTVVIKQDTRQKNKKQEKGEKCSEKTRQDEALQLCTSYWQGVSGDAGSLVKQLKLVSTQSFIITVLMKMFHQL